MKLGRLSLSTGQLIHLSMIADARLEALQFWKRAEAVRARLLYGLDLKV
ncbi:MAG TPA: hypothetical protein VK638_21060 [Edaphobacter sp.]|nr:hypothetical protein [Edaphobacter sp.]